MPWSCEITEVETLTVINRKHRFIYLKSAKTAGTAIEAHLLTRTALGNDIWHTAGDIRKHGLPLHRNNVVLGSIGGRLMVLPEHHALRHWYPWRFHIREHDRAKPLSKRLGGFWDRALKATAVRNPWDIMVSAWSWRRDGRDGRAKPITASFDEWASAALSGDAEWQERVQAYDTRGLMHPYLYADGRLAVDLVIRQERINDGLNEIGERLGISLPPIAVREKTSNRERDYRSYYTDELAESVGDYFADLISLFDYRFDTQPGEAAS
jgi:hypothetical protein